MLEKSQVPTRLRPFIKLCWADPVNYNREEKKKVDERLKLVFKEDGAQQSVTDIKETRFLYENLASQVRVAFYYFLRKG